MRQFPLCVVNVLYLTQKNYTSIASCDPPSKPKTVPRLSSSGSERHVLQCRCQPTPTPPLYNIDGGVGGGGWGKGGRGREGWRNAHLVLLSVPASPSVFAHALRCPCRPRRWRGGSGVRRGRRSVWRRRFRRSTTATLRFLSPAASLALSLLARQLGLGPLSFTEHKTHTKNKPK